MYINIWDQTKMSFNYLFKCLNLKTNSKCSYIVLKYKFTIDDLSRFDWLKELIMRQISVSVITLQIQVLASFSVCILLLSSWVASILKYEHCPNNFV